jgi:hypothetical protein
MSTYDPIALLFGGMAKLGPGSDADTLHVLHLLPNNGFVSSSMPAAARAVKR